VRAAGAAVFSTEVIRAGAAPQEIDVPLAGATEVDLVVDDGGDGRGWDQGDWADARLVFDDGSQVWLDDLAREVAFPAELPFSFVYGGKPSAELLPAWQRTVATDRGQPGMVRHTVALTDPATGLRVTAICQAYTDTPGVDWTLAFTNTGDADTPIIEQARALDTWVAAGIGTEVVLHRLNGSPCRVDDWLPFDQPVAPGQTVEMTTTQGRSSNVSPFFTLDWGSGGVVTGLGWSGQWTAAASLQEGRLRLQAGQQRLRTVLHPGESIRSPRVLQTYWAGGDQFRGCNLFRRTMLAHIVPKVDGRPAYPPIVHLSTSFYELNATNEQNVLSHLEAARGLGFELLWLDAYWTGPSGFPASMGNYGLPVESVEPPDRFPHGVAAVGEAVRAAGLGFLMWFEPERVAPGTRIAREHPDWVISPAGDGSGLLDLGIPAAREYITAYLDAAIKAYGLAWLRIDYNIDPLDFWTFADAKDPNRAGMTEMRYVEGLYRLWDDLRAANPGLLIDNCASGGRRIDVETCSRALPLWRSDNTCDMVGDAPSAVLMAALKNQIMSAGLNRYVPLSTVGQMGAAPYFFRSGFNGGIAFAQDLRPPDFPRQMLREAIAEGQRLRPFWLGNFYPLVAVTAEPRDWTVLQYHRPEPGDGIVLAFRRHQSPYSACEVALRELDPEATYAVTFSPAYGAGRLETVPGPALQKLNLVIPECPGSLLVEYRMTEPAERP
jgi:alpha-galactosidase